MTKYTQNYSLPYPEGNDAVAVHTDIEDLAKRVDTTVKTAIDEVVYYKSLSSGMTADNMRPKSFMGTYRITGAANADQLGLPVLSTGVFKNIHIGGNDEYGHVLQIFDTPENGIWRRSIGSGSDRQWSAWESNTADLDELSNRVSTLDTLFEDLDFRKRVPSNTPADDMRHISYSAHYRIVGASDVNNLGLPQNTTGIFSVYHLAGSDDEGHVMQTFLTRQGNIWTRNIGAGSTSSWTDWQDSSNTVTYLGENDHLYQLGPGVYAQAYSPVPSPTLGYPADSRGVLKVSGFTDSPGNQTLLYMAETGDLYYQALSGGTPTGWQNLTQGNSSSGSGTQISDTTQKLITNTEPGHEWYQEGANGQVVLDDAERWPVGTQSIRVTTDGQGNQTTIQNDNIGEVDLTREDIRVWLRMQERDTHQDFRIRVFSGDPAQYYEWVFTPAQPTTGYLELGKWRKQTLHQPNARRVGSPDPTHITGMSIVSTDTGDGTFQYNLGPIYKNTRSTMFPNGVVTISFDDGNLDNYTVARPIMDKYGIPGTAYVMAYNIGDEGRMSIEQLQDLQNNSGWEIGSHTFAEGFHSEYFTQATEEELDADMANFVAWQKEHDLKGGTFAYPGGQYNELVKKVALRYFKAGRAIRQRWEPLPFNDIGSLMTKQYMHYPRNTVQQVLNDLETAKTQGLWLHLCFHHVREESGSYLQYPADLFEEICEGIYNSGVPVMTTEQVVDRMMLEK